MLTGDHRGAAEAVAREPDIQEVRAEVLPGDKAAVVKALHGAGGTAVFVGEGLNDGPTLGSLAAGCGRPVQRARSTVKLTGAGPLFVHIQQ